MRRTEQGLLALGMALVALGVACGGEDQGPQQSPLVMEKPATKSGDLQFGPVGTALGNPLRVLITRDGQPVEGESPNWGAGQQGSISDQEESDEGGIATAVWTLGPEIGNQAATATIDGADGSPVTFTATATDGTGPPPGPTIQVLGPPDNRFDPAIINITAGQTVTWVWADGAIGHNVLPDDNVHPSRSGPPTDAPEFFTFRFDDVGTFRYYCQTHGDRDGIGMSGRVVVSAEQP